MRTFVKFGVITCAFTTLVACRGTSYEDALLERMEDGERLAYRVDAMTDSGPLVVDNTTGSASFSGVAELIAGPETNGALLFGDAFVRVDFDDQSNVYGSISDIGGLGNVDFNDEDSGNIDRYSGTITLSDGSVGSGNQLEVDYIGTLRGNGDTIVFDGNVTGVFSGEFDIEAVTLGSIEDASYNGIYYESLVAIVAEWN